MKNQLNIVIVLLQANKINLDYIQINHLNFTFVSKLGTFWTKESKA